MGKGSMVNLVCEECGVVFTRPASSHKPNKKTYCCWECYKKSIEHHASVMYIPCDTCGKVYRTTKSLYNSSKRHFCCRACYAVAQVKHTGPKENKSDRVSATRGHKKGKNTRKFCTYTVYDNKYDIPVIIDGTAEQAAKAMGVELNTFYGNIKRTADGKNKRWWIERNYLEGEKVYA